MKCGDDKKGFTLIEIIIVMGIMAMLSTLAINGYIQYRKETLLDLAADNIYSQFNEMKADSVYGQVEAGRFEEIKGALAAGAEEIAASDNSSQCYGIYFEKVADGYLAKYFSQDFVGGKVWSQGVWRYQGCDDPNPAEMTPLSIDQQVNIESIDDVDSDVFVRFIPPNGEIELSENLDKLLLHLGYKNDDNLRYKRELILWTKN